MKKIFIINFIAILLYGCGVNIIIHDEDKAVTEANLVLEILFINENYKEAYDKFDPEFKKHYTSANLKQIVEQVRSEFGNLKEFQVDSFLPMPGKRAITLFYKGIHEDGVSYHRVVLVGDKKGYKVTGLLFAKQPYPEHKLRKKF